MITFFSDRNFALLGGYYAGSTSKLVSSSYVIKSAIRTNDHFSQLVASTKKPQGTTNSDRDLRVVAYVLSSEAARVLVGIVDRKGFRIPADAFLLKLADLIGGCYTTTPLLAIHVMNSNEPVQAASATTPSSASVPKPPLSAPAAQRASPPMPTASTPQLSASRTTSSPDKPPAPQVTEHVHLPQQQTPLKPIPKSSGGLSANSLRKKARRALNDSSLPEARAQYVDLYNNDSKIPDPVSPGGMPRWRVFVSPKFTPSLSLASL
jgi:hypothetical protein